MRHIVSAIAFGLASVSALAFASTNHVVSQRGIAFEVDTLTVAPGDTVEFANDDRTKHHIYARKGPTDFESRLIRPRQSYSVTITEQGVWEVGCKIHPRMRLELISEAPGETGA